MNNITRTITLIIIASLCSLAGYGQVTIGSGVSPVNGALLQLKENESSTENSSKGLGLPLVNLKSRQMASGETNLATTVDGATGTWDKDEHIGLLVYNMTDDLQCEGIDKGIYVWDGSIWVRLSKEELEKTIKGSYEEDVAALKELRNANTGNTLNWTSDDPLTWRGVTWARICGEQRVTGLLIGSKNLLSSSGIEKLYALNTMECEANQFTSLDLSNNTVLEELYCSSNRLISLVVSNSPALKKLHCSYNSLTSLDVSKNTVLTDLNCGSNQLPSLDVSNNTVLTKLYCSSNGLPSLVVSNNTLLEYLYCASNQFTSLDLSNNASLTILDCGSNMLPLLDISNNTALDDLTCSSNRLTSLDISNNTALGSLSCEDNWLVQTELNKLKNNTNFCTMYRVVIPQFIPNSTTDGGVSNPNCP